MVDCGNGAAEEKCASLIAVSDITRRRPDRPPFLYGQGTLEVSGGPRLLQAIQIRPVEVGYLGTNFGSNHIANHPAWQANFKYAAGVNFTFGGN